MNTSMYELIMLFLCGFLGGLVFGYRICEHEERLGDEIMGTKNELKNNSMVRYITDKCRLRVGLFKDKNYAYGMCDMCIYYGTESCPKGKEGEVNVS